MDLSSCSAVTAAASLAGAIPTEVPQTALDAPSIDTQQYMCRDMNFDLGFMGTPTPRSDANLCQTLIDLETLEELRELNDEEWLLVLLITFLYQYLQLLWNSPHATNKGAFTFATACTIFLQASKSMIPQEAFYNPSFELPTPSHSSEGNNCWIWEVIQPQRDPAFAYPCSVLHS